MKGKNQMNEVCRIAKEGGVVHSVNSKFITACGNYFYNRPAYQKTEEPVTCKVCLRTIEEDERKDQMEEDVKEIELCRVKGQKGGVVHSVKHHIIHGHYNWLITMCNRDLYGHSFCNSDIYKITEEPVTCKVCAKRMGLSPYHKTRKGYKMKDNKKAMRFVMNEKTGVVHYIEEGKGSGHYAALPTYTAMCGASLRGRKYSYVKNAALPELCKTCKAVYDRDYGKEQATGKKPKSEQPTDRQYYIAEEAEPGEVVVALSLKDLLEKLKNKWDGDSSELVTALEEGDFTFYKTIKIDIKVEAEVTKEAIKFSEL